MGELELLKQSTTSKTMKVHGYRIDPDELQLMDECNDAWVQEWRKATELPNAPKK